MSAAFDMARLGEVFGNDVSHDADTGATVLTHAFGEEDFLKGHFPGFPVVPGVILLDGMILAGLHAVSRRTGQANPPVRAVQVDQVMFNRPVTPGAPVAFAARLGAPAPVAADLEARASVMIDGVRHARCTLTFLSHGAVAP